MAINAPEGTRDLLPDEALFWNQFKQTAAEVFGAYGYLPIETPIMEQTELFVRGIGEATDVVSKEMFTAISGENLRRWVEEGKAPKAKSRLSLRPEGTAGVVRAVVQHDLVPQGAAPAKLMYAGPMFRAERPQKGRQRQFNQVGVECLGAEEPTIDAEAIIMLMRFYEKVGIPRDSMRLLLNSMGCEQCRPAYRELVRAYMDEHADELCDTCMTRAEVNPLRAFDCKNPQCAAIMADAPKITDHLCDECREHYDAVKVLLDGAGVVYEEDYKLVRGLDYYTRTVFEVQVDNGMGAQNAIGGGATTSWPRRWGAVPRRVSASRSASSAACWPWKRPAWNSRGPRSATCSWPASMIPCAPGPSRSYRNVATPASRPRWITRSAR